MAKACKGCIPRKLSTLQVYQCPVLRFSSVNQIYAKDKLEKTINNELAFGCDGFIFQLNALPTKTSFSNQMALLNHVVRSHSQVAFIHIELDVTEIVRPTLEVLQEYTFPRGCLIASKNPRTLVDVYRLACESQLNLALIVEVEKEFSGLNHCPYSTVEITNALATHDQILRIHNSGKEVFVRAIFNKVSNEKESQNIEKRFRWLKHERVDAIISNRTELLTKVL